MGKQPPPSYENADSPKPSKLHVRILENTVETLEGNPFLEIRREPPASPKQQPVLTLINVHTGASWSTIEYHGNSKGAHINVQIEAGEVVLNKRGKINISYEFNSNVQVGVEFFWRLQDSTHLYLERVGQKTMVARIDDGQLTVLDGDLSKEAWEEIVATGIAMVELCRAKKSGKGVFFGHTAAEAVALALTAVTFFF
ncbi:hypothetical protein HII31_09721 [Pseudocercospora fuligena]|uniref:Uncharacterized protein n=1 Tax=Pseudocercospora fuligena TaxID=685502 RepID=A0A8H6RD50_9PEZI|nr:hypothetical protein HII31_09721 [Pseudocercospora fuligena]